MRKQPVQKRSRFLVDSMVDAASQLIVRDGVDALTTVRVAEQAGVSVGSLYQYFENKQDLIEALNERITADIVAAIDHVAATALYEPPQAFVRALLDAISEAVRGRDGLGNEMLKHWYHYDISEGLYRFEQHMMEVLRNYALAHVQDYRIDPSPARAFIVINSIMFTLLRYRGLTAEPVFGRDELHDQLAAMISGVLIIPPEPSPRSKRDPAGQPE
jgi:AcrR family transcriptional regulator